MLKISVFEKVSNLEDQFFHIKWFSEEIIGAETKCVNCSFTAAADDDDRCQWCYCFAGPEYFKAINSLHDKVGDNYIVLCILQGTDSFTAAGHGCN